MGWASLDNFTLGLASIADAGSRLDDTLLSYVGLDDTVLGTIAKANNTHVSAKVYAAQEPGDDTAEELAARVALDNGALSQAADMTAEQVTTAGGAWLKRGLIAVGVGAGAVVAWRIGKAVFG